MKKRMKISLLLTAVLVLLAMAFTSCGQSYDAAGDAGMPDYKEDTGGIPTTDDVLSGDRKIIKTVYETVETKDYNGFVERLRTAVEETGGYFASSSYSGDGYDNIGNRYASFEIRIPADGLNDFTDTLGGMGSVSYYREESSDVTAAYVDVESRIAVLAAEESALLEILSKSESVSDMLEIRTRLSAVQADLASLKAQKNTYDTLVTYSTVNLTLHEVEREKAVANDTFFGEVGEQFVDSLYGIGSFFRGAGVFFLGNSPVLILVAAIGVGIFFLVRFVVLRSRRKAEEWEVEHGKKDKE